MRNWVRQQGSVAVVLGLLASLAASAGTASAQTFVGTFSNPVTGNTDTASVTFSLANGTLTAVLTNTSTFSAYGNNDLLSGFFFSIDGSPTLTPLSAITPSMVNPSGCASAACAGTDVDVGYEWGYQYSASGFAGSTLTTSSQYGVSAAGYSLLSPNFGSGNVSKFGSNPPNLDGGNGALGGLDFSLVSASYNNSASANSLRSLPFANTSIAFGWTVPTGVTALAIRGVSFSYGTNPDASVGATAPEPAGLMVFGVGLTALMLTLRRRRGGAAA